MKTITVNDVKIELIAEMEEMIAIHGNAIASGNNEYDLKVEKEIMNRLESGDIWAWAQVEVKCTYKGILTASDYLGACSYESAEDFKKDGYYEDMVNTCLYQLNQQLKDLCE